MSNKSTYFASNSNNSNRTNNLRRSPQSNQDDGSNTTLPQADTSLVTAQLMNSRRRRAGLYPAASQSNNLRVTLSGRGAFPGATARSPPSGSQGRAFLALVLDEALEMLEQDLMSDSPAASSRSRAPRRNNSNDGNSNQGLQ